MYIEVADLKAYLSVTVSTHDDLLEEAIAAASMAIDNFCERHFFQTEAQERVYEPFRSVNLIWIEIDDLMGEPISFDPDGDYTLHPLNNALKGKPFTHVRLSSWTDQVTIEGEWGWEEVPATIKEATKIQAARFYKRKDAPFGVAGTESEMRLLNKLDPDVEMLVKPYKREWGIR